MADFNVVQPGDFNTGFTVGTDIALNVQGSLTQDGTGAWGVSLTGLQIIDPAGTNLLNVNGAGQVLFTQADLQAAETAWAGTAPGNTFMGITAGGTNGHAPTFTFDFSDADFIEGVQDAVGQAVLAGAGVTYDDVANAISTTLGNLTFGNGLLNSAGTVSVQPDAAASVPVTVGAGGVSVDPAAIIALATVDICDLAGNVLAKAYPN